MTNVKNGNIEFIGQFTPETDPNFWMPSPDGQNIITSISGIEDLVFLAPCGQVNELKQSENSDDCVVLRITDAKD